MLIDELKQIVGPKGWTTDSATLESHVTEGRGKLRGKTPIVLMPSSTSEVASVVRACAGAGVAIVPQGGNTGLCGGAVPDASGKQVVLNLSRMSRIRDIDAGDFSMTVEAGCILANIQQAAREVGRLFPLSLGAEGSCQIGGNLSTNAGGINVIRYGTARNLVLGLEVVLADGSTWDGLRSLRKDTAGYDLKQLFIGSEGTLGIITAATLKLFPEPGETQTLLIAIDTAGRSVSLLGEFRTRLGDSLQSFELVGKSAFDLVEKHIPDCNVPFDEEHPWYVLVEVAGMEPNVIEKLLSNCANDKLLLDAVVAKNQAEADRLWRMRHSISEAQKLESPSVKHDISVPIGRIEDFLSQCEHSICEQIDGAELVVFGHVGDGNLHYNVFIPGTPGEPDYDKRANQVYEIVYGLVADLGGSFSAEHGVGVLKREFLARYRGTEELALMKSLKNALDPANILNPGKVI